MNIAKISRYLLLATLVMTAACADDEQPSDSRAQVEFNRDTLVTVAWASISMNDGTSAWLFEGPDFTMSAADTNLFVSPQVKTGASGTLKMEFQLVAGGDVLFSEGVMYLPLSPNWRWTFEFIHSIDDPILDCDGCIGYLRYDVLDPAHDQESIFVIYKGHGP
jgi:hypothetical protein